MPRGAEPMPSCSPNVAVTGYAYDFSTLRREEIRDALAAVGSLAAAMGVNVLIGSPVFAGQALQLPGGV